MEKLTPDEANILRRVLEHELNLWHGILESDSQLDNGMEVTDRQHVDALHSIWKKIGL